MSVHTYHNLYTLCFNLGKWIYFIDAYDDYDKDTKKGKFNLLKTIFEEDHSEKKIKAHKKIATINEMLIFKMKESFEKISFKKNGEILFNIIFLGCMDVYLRIIDKKYPFLKSEINVEYDKRGE